MNIKLLEKIKGFTEEIEKVIDNLELQDDTSIHLRDRLKEFSDSLTFELKNEIFEEYNKNQEKLKGTIK